MNTPHFTGLPPTVYTTSKVDVSHIAVNAVDGFPGRYSIKLDNRADMNLHVTAAQWDAIDNAVRNGILAAQTKAIS